MRRREFLLSPAPLLLPHGLAAAGFPEKPEPRALFPAPKDGQTVGLNPPGFAWWRAKGASDYRIVIRDAKKREVYAAAGLPDPVHVPCRSFRPGRYSWDVEALDESGGVLARRGPRSFTIPREAPEFPWQDATRLLRNVPDTRPRYIFLADRLPRIRETLKTTRREAWEAIRARADEALKLPLPEPPRYHTFEGRTRQRMGYTHYFRDFRRYIDRGMSILALAYLMTGDERYGLAAKKILLEVETWGIEGPMSVLSRYGDEPGLSMARHGHRAYDWLYPLLDDGERARVREMTIGRARQVLERLRRADYLYRPGESHNGRLIAYLAEYAVVCKGEARDAAEWLDYSLRALMTFYPHWAGSDGGWAEGVSYALAYNTIYLPALESLRAAAGLDLYRRPFYRRIRRFFLYCTSPIGEMRPFGDGAERGGVGSAGAALMLHHGRRFRDPACVWYARQTGAVPVGADAMVSLITEDDVQPKPPASLPQAAVFRGVGWAGLHSALDKPEQDTFFLFKSSPYGSVSHSHADQNGFAILKGGRALAIPSGHYAPSYGMPHHALWTRQTKANNCILVNGEGQVVREPWANGRITGFRHQKAITYVCGDATPAYAGKLKRYLRHVVFLRPGAVLVADEIEAPQPARFQWLLHALERMELDEGAVQILSRRQGASLTVRLFSDLGFSLSQTDQFHPPVNEGNPPEYHVDLPNHWHMTAATNERAAKTVIVAAMAVAGPGERLETEWIENGLRITTPEGSGLVRAVTAPGLHLEAEWNPRRGAGERFSL